MVDVAKMKGKQLRSTIVQVIEVDRHRSYHNPYPMEYCHTVVAYHTMPFTPTDNHSTPHRIASHLQSNANA